ncbi:diguanylate cyclase domain-containing protein [Paenibacillus sp. YN15]|uniref:diguanylate cyclase domain-containing protein n=1 Tax=Paenibacillus sp. YN15 TaxID=1742774 RepID=UPI000DCC2D6F|nr:diguanylate cyclase [Paenibacillus sp. YN15]RAU99575.1 GGDEF domain-containing protein [Paenibacillus sp. YN15]
MRRTSPALVSDAALVGFMLLCLVAILFITADPEQAMVNVIMLAVAFLIAVITFFSSVTAGLVLNVMFIFGYGSLVLYQTVAQAGVIEGRTYFWLLMTPLFTLAMWLYSWSARRLQEENDSLREQSANLATLDVNTDLKNSLAFQKDAGVFTGLSVRYNIPLTLLVLKVRYWQEIRRFIPADQLSETILDISRISQSSIRTNDILYLLDKEEATWGLLLFTDKEGAKVVMERIRQKLYEFNTGVFTDKYKVKLVLKIGAVEYSPETIPSPLAFVEQAVKQLEYDV